MKKIKELLELVRDFYFTNKKENQKHEIEMAKIHGKQKPKNIKAQAKYRASKKKRVSVFKPLLGQITKMLFTLF